MAQSSLPIKFSELLQLSSLGINEKDIGFASVTMGSEKFICVRESASGQPSVSIIDLNNPHSPTRRPMSADACIMNPESQVIAVRARDSESGKDSLQVFNLELKSRMKTFEMTDQVAFWKWISVNTIAIVTGSAVYHWSMDANSNPKPVFQRNAALTNHQIINYIISKDEKWACVIGISRQPDGRIAGQMQLRSFERNQDQAIEGHAACFAEVSGSCVFCFAQRTASGSKLHTIEVQGSQFGKKNADIFFPPDASTDFPVGLQFSSKYNVLYLITQQGYLHMFDLHTCTTIYRNRISAELIFTTTAAEKTGGAIFINRKGQVLSVTVDEQNIVPYIQNTLNNAQLAFEYSKRNNLGGAEELFRAQFQSKVQQGQIKEAAQIAGDSPNGFLRTQDTIDLFKKMPTMQGGAPPLLQYFGVLLEHGSLNATESIELVRMVLQLGRQQLIEKWLKEDKLTCSEELGDLVKQTDGLLALSVYLRANAHIKVIQSFAESGQYDKIIVYAKRSGYTPDYLFILNNILRINQAGALDFAQKLLNDESGALVEVGPVVDAFVQRNMIQEATSLLLDVLKPDRPEDADLQTRLLEINLTYAAQVADAILGKDMFHHYDRHRIAVLCEKAGLPQRALEHYEDINDIKRVITMQVHLLNMEFITNYFGQLSTEDSLEILKEMLQQRTRNALQVVVQVATRYTEQLSAAALIEMFESFNQMEGMFYYLNAIVTSSEDPEVHFKYIQAAAKINRFEDVKRIVRESNVYDPERVKEYLMEAKLPDQIPLIIVCDRFDFVEELTHYLYKNNMSNKIEIYVQRVNPLRTPQVVGALLDSDCDDGFIKNLIKSVRNMCPAEELVEQVEKRNRLKLLQGWLEDRVAEGNTDAAAHNALAKIYVDSNNDPEHFLNSNQYYDSLVVGKYCEKRDPHLAYIAYKRGQCDFELVDITNRTQLFKQQARYLVERKNLELWEHVLQEENEHRRSVIDQVVSTALPECKSADAVSITVKAFMAANLPHELIELLEKIVMENSEFSTHASLQNLLILTAIKADPSRVMDYVNRLDNYKSTQIASICIQNELFEEAYTVYHKFDDHVSAIKVVIDNLKNLERAYEYAERCNEPEVWSVLAKAQLAHEMVAEAVSSFIKADDATEYISVIHAANVHNCYEDLVRYLTMARKKVKDPFLDTEFIFAYAKIDALSELEDFLSQSNVADKERVGDRCFDHQLYEAARVIFENMQNYPRLASTYVKLGRYQQAVDAARKANRINTWKEMNAACVEAGEFNLAKQCAQYIIIQPDELDELVRFYEMRGHFEEIIAVLEQGVSHERAHTGLFTSLGIVYSKYRPEKLMEHLKLYITKISIPRLIRVVEQNLQWKELTFLYKNYNEYDNAALTMMEHSPDAWEDTEFKDVVVKVSNTDIFYKAITFYLNEHCDRVNALLGVLQNKVDHVRVVQMVRKMDELPLIKGYLKSVQNLNINQVNDALNDLYVQEEDFESLQLSIDTHDNFDNLGLAKKCKTHELIEFRKIAAYIYRKNKKWQISVEISKGDKLYQDAMETAAESREVAVAEDLLSFFVENGLPECFAACLFVCYDLLRPDVVLELAWRKGLMNFAMPYMIQMLREYTTKVDNLIVSRSKDIEKKQKEDEQKAEQEAAEAQMYQEAVMSQLPTVSMLPDPSMMMSGYQPAMMSGMPPSNMSPYMSGM